MNLQSKARHHQFLSSIEEVVEDARNGRMFILVDAEERENEGDLVIPAQMATPDSINFMAKHGLGRRATRARRDAYVVEAGEHGVAAVVRIAGLAEGAESLRAAAATAFDRDGGQQGEGKTGEEEIPAAHGREGITPVGPRRLPTLSEIRMGRPRAPPG